MTNPTELVAPSVEMVEKVARAICGAQPHMLTLKQISVCDWSIEVEHGWEACRDEARAAVSVILPEGWRDIATAPKDGTWVDLWYVRSVDNFGARVTDAAWLGGKWRQFAEYAPEDYEPEDDLRFFDGYGYCTPVETTMCKVTHWMKVAAPISAATSGKEGGRSNTVEQHREGERA